jgi:fibronectin type 3 domain-containing protein
MKFQQFLSHLRFESGLRLRGRGMHLVLGIFVASVTLVFATSSLAQTSVPLGTNGNWDWVNIINGVTTWNVLNPTPTSPPVPEDANGNPTSDFGVTLIDSRKNMPFAGPDQLGINEDISGTYLVSFQGEATITPNTEITTGNTGVSVQNQSYDAGSNTTTAQVVLQPGFGLLQISFTNTQATASAATNTGVTGLKVIRPGYPLNTIQVFTSGSLQFFQNAPVVNDRFLGPDDVDDYNNFTGTTPNTVVWANRVKVTDVHQGGTQAENAVTDQAHGVAWEYMIQFANATNTDMWINIPDLANSDYIQNLATLILNGNQYTAGLKSNLHVYFEQGNEDWNPGAKPNQADNILAGEAGINEQQEYVAHTIANAKIFQSVFNQSGATGRVRPVVLWQYTTQLQIFDALAWWEQTNNDKVSKYIYGIGEAPYYSPDDYSSVDAIFNSMYNNSDRTRRDFIGWQAVAAYFGTKEVGYESGPSLTIGPSAAAIRDPRIIASVHHHFLDNWYAVGGDLVNYFAEQDHVNYFGDWLTVEDFEHYDTPTFAGVTGVLNASQPPLTAGQVLPWSVGQTVVLDPSQVVNSPFGSDQAPNTQITVSSGSDNIYLLRSTGSGTYSVSFYAQGQSGSSTALDVYVDDSHIGSVNVGGSPGTTSSLSFNAGVGFHTLSLVETGSAGVVFPASTGAIDISLSSGSGTAVVPSAPENLSIVAGDGQAALTWAATATATSYTVSRSTTSGGPFTPVTTVSSNRYTDTGLTDGTTYYYVVQAVNSVGTGANSPQVPVFPGPTTIPSAPAAPTVAMEGGDGALFYGSGIAIVSWQAVPNASGYNVYKSTNGGVFTLVNQNNQTDGYNESSGPQAALQWTDRFVNNGDTDSYTVTAVNANGESAQSSATSATAVEIVHPAPTLSITQRDGFNLLTWVPDPLWNPQFSTAFNVKRSTQSSGPYTTIIQINTDDAYDYTAAPGTTYYYVVTQTNSAGESAPSNEVSGEPSTQFVPGNCGGDTTPNPYPSVPSTNAGCGAPGSGGSGTTAVNTTTSLSIGPDTSTLTEGESYTLTATVSPASGTTTPTGNVVFTIGSSTQTVALNSSGVAAYTGTAPSSTGTLSLSAQYQGTSSFNSSTSSTLTETITAPSGGGGSTGSITIPNYSFEQGGVGYNVPSNWTFVSSGTTSNNYAVQYISNSTTPPAEDGSDYWDPGDFNPSSETNGSYGTSTSTLTTSASVGSFAANTTYTLTVALADPADGTDPSEKSVGFQLLANGNVVANYANTSLTPGANFTDYSLTFDTASNTSAVGQPITIALVYSYSGQYNRNAYFDNVRLTTASDSGSSGGSSGEGPYQGTAVSIPGTVEASNYDTGGQGVSYNQTTNGGQTGYRTDNSGAIEANSADNNSPANGYDLGWTASGQYYKYTVSVASAGAYTATFSVASPSGQTDAFHLQDSSGTNLSGNINVPNTGSWYSWQTVTATVTLPAGTQTLTLTEDNGGWNVEYFTLASSGGGSSSPAQVSLSGVANAIGITADGTGFSGGGIDGDGYAYSSNQIGTSLTDSAGTLFNFGTPDAKDVVNGSSAPVVPLTSGKYSTLKFLGLGVNGDQSGQFTVTYSDGSSDQFTRGLSDWFSGSTQTNETVADTYQYRDNNQGAQAGGPLHLYEYSLAINNNKTVKSLTLPNNQNIVVVAATLVP